MGGGERREEKEQEERARADIVIKEKMYVVNLLDVGGMRCIKVQIFHLFPV